MNKTNFLLAGVGGQGTLLASGIIADVGLKIGADVKQSEVHGMSQRGGAVTSHVRWAEKVASPLCELGTVDYVIAQEMLEALRWIEFLRPGGTVVLSRQKIAPTSTVYSDDLYPEEEHVRDVAKQAADKVLLVDATRVAEELGNLRVSNSVLLGALAAHLEVSIDDWIGVVGERVPERHIETNRQAFLAGCEGDWLI